MHNKFPHFLKLLLVCVGATALTSFGVEAVDSIRIPGAQTALGILASKATEASCPPEMIMLKDGESVLCVDKYEVTPSRDCPLLEPKSNIDTALNISSRDCVPESKSDAWPWTFVAMPQARELCAKVGKRLPTPEEWFIAALGTPDSNDCNIEGSLGKTGSFGGCYSGVGAYDMVGNVWEWVEVDINKGKLLDRFLPNEGYIKDVDTTGVATITSESPEVVFNKDYFWLDSNVEAKMMRGGFYGSGSKGGVYAVHAKNEANFAGQATGFRCVKNI